MTDIQRLEMLSESIKNEIEELESFIQNGEKYFLKSKTTAALKALSNIRSNLESANDSIYGVFEDLNAADNSEELQTENEVMRELLREKLTYEEKRYYSIRHGIDFF